MWPFKHNSQPKPAASSSLPEGLIEALDAAYRSGGQWFLVLAHHDASATQPNRYWRRSNGFPVAELGEVVGMLERDVAEERVKMRGRNGAGRMTGIPRR